MKINDVTLECYRIVLSSIILYGIVLCPDDHHKIDDGLIKQKMELQSKQVIKLTIPQIYANTEQLNTTIHSKCPSCQI
jgi:hypothetical protein